MKALAVVAVAGVALAVSCSSSDLPRSNEAEMQTSSRVEVAASSPAGYLSETDAASGADSASARDGVVLSLAVDKAGVGDAPASVAQRANGEGRSELRGARFVDQDGDGIPDTRTDAATTLAPAVDAALAKRCEAIFTRALEDSRAITQLRDLVAAAPKRLSGSKGYEDAVVFATRRLHEIGCADVRTEPVLVPCWVRGEEAAAVTSPEPTQLRVTSLGGSVATPVGGLEAEVVMVKSFEQLRELGDKARGKIVFFNRAMPRAFLRTFQAYGDAVPQRSKGAVEAAKVGAVAAIVRSMTTSIDGYPHTGAMRYAEGVEKVPAAAIATEDAEALARMLAEPKTPVKVKLVLGCRSEPDVMSHNVIAEIRGSERPDEVIVLGGHLDAWDLGEGAHDDGAGCAQTIEAMRLLVACGIKPKRTVRAVLFANEENGLRGGAAYDAAHANEHHVAAIETDSGGATPFGFSCTAARDQADPYRALLAPLAAYHCDAFAPGGGGGADIGPLAARGVPCFGLVTDSQRYFDYHHSALDVVANVNERELALGAAAVAYLAVALADR